MLHRLREAMTDNTGKLGGGDAPVEIDETFVGGKVKNMHKSKQGRTKRNTDNKTIVLGCWSAADASKLR